MNNIIEIQDFSIIVYILKIYIISITTFYASLKIIDAKFEKKFYIVAILFIINSVLCGILKVNTNSLYSIIFLDLATSAVFSKILKKDIFYSILIVTVSLCMSYIVFLIAAAIVFIPSALIKFNKDYTNLFFIGIVNFIIINKIFKIKRIKDGISFLKNKEENEYFNIIIINVSVIILFFIIILSNYQYVFTNSILWAIILYTVILVITINKSLQLCYKQNLLIQDLNETKNELDDKKKEIEELEKENLSFSKTSHSIAHKQKVLEYKLNELILKNEIADELEVKDRIRKISEEISNKSVEIQLTKTDIPQIDDMLKYMQSECIKNKIDFQLQISGNIHHMINKYISKEDLEILLADHIKNAIIAINYSENINKSILVRLGEIEGIYSLYVYDSGIEFEKETLKSLGKKPSTTHADNGGTGMGFMNTFDTLNKYNASLVIEEYNEPCKENYTKLIKIEFNNKNEFKIKSYRNVE